MIAMENVTLSSEVHSLKALSPTVVNNSPPKFTFFKELHPWNADISTKVTDPGNATSFRLSQSLKVS
jgi:hypothetical protein